MRVSAGSLGGYPYAQKLEKQENARKRGPPSRPKQPLTRKREKSKKVRVSAARPEQQSYAQKLEKQESARKRGRPGAAFLRAKERKARKRA